MLPGLVAAGSTLLGGVMDNLFGASAARKARAREDSAIQRRVADANAAGVHPLFALGANVSSSAPVHVGSMGSTLANMGQDVSRAMSANRPPQQVESSFNKAMQTAQLERVGLENTLLRKQILSAGSPPPAPGGSTVVGGAGDSRRVVTVDPLAPVVARPHESTANDMETEYGEFGSDFVGAYRLVRDALPQIQKWLNSEFRPRVSPRTSNSWRYLEEASDAWYKGRSPRSDFNRPRR